MPESELETELETAGSLHHLRKIDLEGPSIIGCGPHPKFHIDSGTLGKRPGNMAALSGD